MPFQSSSAPSAESKCTLSGKSNVSNMIYNLQNALDLERFKAKVSKSIQNSSVVELTEKTARTSSQNRYLHLLIGVVAMDVGVTLDYAKQEYFKRLVNHDIFSYEVEDKFWGKVKKLRSSAELNKEQMSMAIDRFKRWGTENGIYMPNPEDTALLREIEIEMGRMRGYL